MAFGAAHKKKQPAARRIALLIDEQGKIAKIYDPAGTGEFPAKCWPILRRTSCNQCVVDSTHLDVVSVHADRTVRLLSCTHRAPNLSSAQMMATPSIRKRWTSPEK